jgi:hypothetical protein
VPGSGTSVKTGAPPTSWTMAGYWGFPMNW